MTIKQKNSILLAGFVFMMWVAYQLSFSKTIDLKNQYQVLKKEQQMMRNVSQKLDYLNQQNKHYDAILKSKRIAVGSSFQNNLLKAITSYCKENHLKVITFNKPHIHLKDNASINTYSFVIRGDFTKVNHLIYELEQTYKFGIIKSVHFEKKKNYRHNNYYLDCTILLQQIES